MCLHLWCSLVRIVIPMSENRIGEDRIALMTVVEERVDMYGKGMEIKNSCVIWFASSANFEFERFTVVK